MNSTRSADAREIRDLEALLHQRRRRLTKRKMRRFVIAENVLARKGLSVAGGLNVRPPRSPESWRGDNGQQRHFRSLTPMPVGKPAANDRALPPPSGKSAAHERTLVLGAGPAQRTPERSERRSRDALLLAVEVLALVAFLAILGSMYARLQALNRQASQVQRQNLAPEAASSAEASGSSAVTAPEPLEAPTATPVRLLPGGRPTSGPVSVPPSLQGLVRASVPLSAPPTPGPKAPRRMVIPKLGVDAPVIEGDDWEDLKKGIGHRPGTADPGEPNNMVVSAHNDIYGEIFRDLVKLEVGDEVLVYTDEGAYRYVVNSVEIVSPTKVEVMDPTEYPVLTMITCYPYLLNTHRVVATADLAE
ncbi:MAG: sortase [Chloroflexi bacterium]|nr:sortase [Chloroflexota bacterium]